jgi:hypothetical protein
MGRRAAASAGVKADGVLGILNDLPGPVGGFGSHDGGDLGRDELGLQVCVLAVDRVGHHQAEGDARRARLLDQLPGERRCGGEVGVFAALGQATGGAIGCDARAAQGGGRRPSGS